MTDSEDRANEYRDAVEKVPSRAFRPSKRQGAAGLSTIVALLLLFLRFAVYQSHSHVDDTAYLECIARAQTTVQDTAGLGFPEPDPSFGDPAGIGDPGGPSLGDAVSACSQYPH